MKPRLRAPSPASVIALIALFLALGGGAAAYASGLISGSQIKNHSIAENKLTKAAIKDLGGHAYSVHVPNAVAIHPGTGYRQVASLSLPAGSYIVIAKTVLHNAGSTGGTCRLRDTRAGTLDITSGSSQIDTLTLLSPLVTRGSNLQLQCTGQGAEVSAGFTHLVAINVGSVKGS
jgi:hypothetical protein